MQRVAAHNSICAVRIGVLHADRLIVAGMLTILSAGCVLWPLSGFGVERPWNLSCWPSDISWLFSAGSGPVDRDQGRFATAGEIGARRGKTLHSRAGGGSRLHNVRLGAFDEREHLGTFLLWNLERIQRRVQMPEKGLPVTDSLIRMPVCESFMVRPV